MGKAGFASFDSTFFQSILALIFRIIAFWQHTITNVNRRLPKVWPCKNTGQVEEREKWSHVIRLQMFDSIPVNFVKILSKFEYRKANKKVINLVCFSSYPSTSGFKSPVDDTSAGHSCQNRHKLSSQEEIYFQSTSDKEVCLEINRFPHHLKFYLHHSWQQTARNGDRLWAMRFCRHRLQPTTCTGLQQWLVWGATDAVI